MKLRDVFSPWRVFRGLAAVVVKLEKIMTTQAELAQTLAALGGQLDKARDEIVAHVQQLEDALGNAGNVTPEVEAALAALKAKVQVLDDLNADQPTP